MAVSIAGSEFDDEGDFAETHEINVTPFIDVMLVLLIIFMVAAPLATVDLPVDLPTSSAVSQKKPDKPVYVTIQADLTVAIQETPVKRVDLIHALDTMPGVNPETAKDRTSLPPSKADATFDPAPMGRHAMCAPCRITI